ncbi:MAG: 30S ribosomal protein S9 [Actinobacteria bacterium]|nr:30S ribosomal protein S9 [Actinomycetota bacterium]NDG76774.1 30S ribosomal protein S9 [Acidimicrobiia bacterium]NBO80375.1 30S ribosomal protein S9 [Actinomycetota bacterium]NBP17082.1 30S ribosomal protein S9 [Actinomycetota bacterium]NBR76608.1 30S ribosomal protein S9 [Actinomycetota bacterium]
MATKPLTQTTGRRKSAVSRARLRAGSGRVTVNGRAFETYFPTTIHRNNATEALRITGTMSTYDIDVDIAGGGPAGQSGAMRLAIARSLVALDPSHRPALKRAGLLARDARRKESKKYGLKKARKAPQYTKR